MPRRCLTFDMAGVRRKSFGIRGDSRTLSPLLHNGKQAASSTPGIPRIGLHLNSVASIPLDRFVQDVLPSASQHSVNVSSSIIGSSDMQNKLHNSMSAEKSHEPNVQDILIVQDCDTQPSDVGKSDDLSQNSPKNKKYVLIVYNIFHSYCCLLCYHIIHISTTICFFCRRRTETEGDSCRRCNCKKSKCLKL